MLERMNGRHLDLHSRRSISARLQPAASWRPPQLRAAVLAISAGVLGGSCEETGTEPVLVECPSEAEFVPLLVLPENATSSWLSLDARARYGFWGYAAGADSLVFRWSSEQGVTVLDGARRSQEPAAATPPAIELLSPGYVSADGDVAVGVDDHHVAFRWTPQTGALPLDFV